MKDYDVMHFIEEKMQGENEDIKEILKRMYMRLDKNKVYASCLSTSVTLCLAIKEKTGIAPDLILGSISYQGIAYAHAWIEIENKVYDLAIALDTKYHPMLKEHIKEPVPVQINMDKSQNKEVRYYPFAFNSAWPITDMHMMVGKTFEQYMEKSPSFDLYDDICYVANITATKNNLKEIQSIAKDWEIKDVDKYGKNVIVPDELDREAEQKQKKEKTASLLSKLRKNKNKKSPQEPIQVKEKYSVEEWLTMAKGNDKKGKNDCK